MATFSLRAQEFTTPGSHTFNVPLLCSGFVIVSGVGAGGAGGLAQAANTGGGGGGGAGQTMQRQFLKVTPGGTLPIVIGAGGAPNSIAVSGLYPVTTILKTDSSQAGYGSRTGLGFGDGGGLTSVGILQLLPGAGAARGGNGGGGGVGGGARQWGVFNPHGNEGFRVGTIGGDGTATKPKDGNCFHSGAGGAAGSAGAGITGGKGAAATWNPQAAGGAPGPSSTDGGGSGGSSWMAPGGAGGNGNAVGSDGGRGAGGGGAGEAIAGTVMAGFGGDAYIVLQWFELDPT